MKVSLEPNHFQETIFRKKLVDCLNKTDIRFFAGPMVAPYFKKPHNLDILLDI